jgi:ABC-type dipeptide/oligopeptide/nickel transport system permease component
MLIITLIVFILGHYGPGDPVEVMLGNNYTEELADSIREKKVLMIPSLFSILDMFLIQ